MLIHRVWTAAIFAPALLGLVYLGGLPLAVTCLVLAVLMMWEFLQMTLGPGEHFTKAIGYLFAGSVCVALLGWVQPALGVLLVPAGTMLLFFAMVVRPEPLEMSTKRASLVALGVLYTAGLIPFVALLRAHHPQLGLGLSLMAIFCTWGADSGAYFSGRALGRRKLYPTVSPGKTVEGGIGGVLSAIGVAFFVRWLFNMDIAVGHAVALGAVAGLFGIIGDLAESLLKRSVGAKDSSRLIPGHGGVLDRFDGVLFVVPAMYVYVVTLL